MVQNNSLDAETSLFRLDLLRTTKRIRQYREQMSLCETVGVFALSERIRDGLVRALERQVELATALRAGTPRQARAKSTNPASGSVCTNFTRA
jgi:hypothetical protein